MPWNLVKRLTSCNSLQLLVFNLAQARSLPGIAYISEESTDIMKAGKSMNFFEHTLFNSFFCNPWTFPWRQMAVLEERDEAAYHGQVLEWLIMVTKVRHDTWNITESFCSSSCRTPRTCSRLTRRDSELRYLQRISDILGFGCARDSGVGKRMKKRPNQTDVLTALSETRLSDPESRLSRLQ